MMNIFDVLVSERFIGSRVNIRLVLFHQFLEFFLQGFPDSMFGAFFAKFLYDLNLFFRIGDSAICITT